MSRVLIVDDDASMRRLLVRALEREFECEQAVSVSHAQQKLSYAAFDVVVLDYVMPDGSGSELLEFIRALQHPPAAIVLTALAESRLQRLRELMDCIVLSKPVDLDLLLTTVRDTGGRIV